VARSTRQQRRQRRAQAAGTPPRRPPSRPVERDEAPEPRQPAESRSERRGDVQTGVPGFRFVLESWGELKKVEWPNQQALISGTAVVIIACLITGLYLWLNDQLWQYVVEHVFLR
jgi:preprotein translocase SecE subunit